MKYDPALHHRRSIRLDGYDYAQSGAYFVTLVAHERECLFGEVVGEEMRLNTAGQIVRYELQRLEQQFHNLQLPAFVIMPNHIHAIIVLEESTVGATHPDQLESEQSNEGSPKPAAGTFDVGATLKRSKAAYGSPLHRPSGPPTGSLGAIIGQFKSRVTRRLGLTGQVWQRNYYEHIIRDQAEMEKIAAYIEANPVDWLKDEEYPG
jgi:putative transposase